MEVFMKYSLISSAVSLVLYHHELLSSAGLFGYLAGILYLVTYRANATLIAIGCIATAIITVMYFNWDFSFTGYMTVGVAWSMTILALTVILTIVTKSQTPSIINKLEEQKSARICLADTGAFQLVFILLL